MLKQARPFYLTECWRYPYWEFPSAEAASVLASASSSEPDLLFLPMADWHARTQRTQHLARALAEAGHRCFYLNPHLGFEYAATYSRCCEHRLAQLAPRLFELHIRLPSEPVIHQRLPSRRESRILYEVLRRSVELSRGGRLIQIVSLPFWLEVAKKLKDSHQCPIVYDCHDHLSGFERLSQEIIGLEAEMFRHSDLIVFSSQTLLDGKTAGLPWLRAKSILIRNAAGTVETPPRQVERARSKKIIGYVGSLDHWFDVECVRQAALRRADWEYVLIGRIEDPSVLQLAELPNVKFLGELPHSELDAHLSGFDAALIPFRINELTLAVNPIKLYEYFSYGLPVVSTNLPEVSMFGKLVYIGGNPEDFADKVETAALESDASIRQKRISIARRETWAARARQLQAAFAALMANRDLQSARVPPEAGPEGSQS